MATDFRVRLTAHLRYLLLDQGCQPVRADLLSQFIHELTDHDTPISGLVLSATVASVLKICNIVGKQQPGVRSSRGGPDAAND